MSQVGDACVCCHKERLVIINGALVCRNCDCANEWPNKKRPAA